MSVSRKTDLGRGTLPPATPRDFFTGAMRHAQRHGNRRERTQAHHQERGPEIRPRDARMAMQYARNLQHDTAYRHAQTERHLLHYAAETRGASYIAAGDFRVSQRVETRELQRREEAAEQDDEPDDPGRRAGKNSPHAAIDMPESAAFTTSTERKPNR